MSRSTAEPQRTCIGCRRRAPQRLLVRFVAFQGRLMLGAGGSGRGAWLCAATMLECFDDATKRRRWGSALRAEIDGGSVAELRNQLLNGPMIEMTRDSRS